MNALKRQPVDEIVATRDLFVLVLGLAGVVVGAIFGLLVSGRSPEQVARLAAWATPTSGAVTAVLVSDVFLVLRRSRPLASLLLRLGLLGLNAILFVVELLVLVVALLSSRGVGL
ncbi:MAG: hypothetical protein ABIJ09_12335 [Pseudomonadota bacterium]